VTGASFGASADRVGSGAYEAARARCSGHYALSIYLPLSSAARSINAFGRRLRGGKPAGQTRLPQTGWTEVLSKTPILLVETRKQDGNVKLSEVAILAQAASSVPPGSEIIEIGTFDGRTAINLAVNAPAGVKIATLDLPASHPTAHPLDGSERRYVEKPSSGERLRACHPRWRDCADRVVQLFGDSASYDWSSRYGKAGLVFVDGSHTFEYARRDSETALRLVRAQGVVLWHDYGVWPGVTRALEELEASRNLGLRHIRGTSLVFWRAPADLDYVADAPAGQDYADDLSVAPTEAPVDQDMAPVLRR
jgi:hypothetical protein